jgi:hypothetical protein
VKEWLKLHIVHTDHVVIRSELKYLIGGKIVNLKYLVFDGKTGPFPMVQVFGVVRPVAMVPFRVESYPEPIREIAPVANTTRNRCSGLELLLTLDEIETRNLNLAN